MAQFINEAIDGVVAALLDHFPYPVYDERVMQGMDTPSFYVHCIQPKQERYRGRRLLVEQLIEVVFFPADYRTNNNVLEKLFTILEVIHAGDDLIRGTNPQVNVNNEDGTIVFTMMYRYFAHEIVEETPMNTLETNFHGKDD